MKKNKRCNLHSKRQQQGVIIVIVLFFVAIIATISYYMVGRIERDTRRSQLLLRNVNAELNAQGSILWAQEQLKLNLANQKPDAIVDKMPLSSGVDEVNGYKISSVIRDVQGKFNLNSLGLPESQADFKKLLHLLKPDLGDQTIDEIIQAIVDWITPGEQLNKLNKYYMSLNPPYQAAHQMFFSTSELQLVKGIEPALYQLLKDYVVALPTVGPINILTASAPVLACLNQEMNLQTGVEIEKICREKPPTSMEAFNALEIMKNHQIKKEKMTMISNFFLVETRVEIENQQLVLYTLLERKDKSNINIIWQSKILPG